MNVQTATILIVDDDIQIGNLLQESLEEEGYGVLRAYSGTEAMLLLSQTRPDLVLLDLMLPGLSGEELLAKLSGQAVGANGSSKASPVDVPVIVVSAKVDVEDKVGMLLGGACDYVTKPFAVGELLARIELRLREADRKTARGDMLAAGDITIWREQHKAFVQETEVSLTRTEYAILKLLVERPGQVLTKSVLLDEISMDTPDCTESSLKTHVSNLRKKLRDISGRNYIEAVWGIGFKLKSEV
ncbi:MAG: response regulator transcription factor [Lachnospiraceae bacterium]|nr:response regulator transcription factor [Lachnospiraceae bacterium]